MGSRRMAERKGKGIAARLDAARGFVIDMDGTLVLGDRHNRGLRALPGAVDFLAHLKAKEIPYVLFTNGTVRPPRDYVGKLADAGLEVAEHRIMTPSSVAAEYLKAKGYSRVMAMGGEGVSAPLAEAGLEIAAPRDPKNVDAIFVGWFREFTMEDIEAACEAVWGGAKVFAASLVPYFATSAGRTLGTSCAIAGAIEKITGARARVLGKPAPEALAMARRRLGVAARDLAVIGDDPRLEIPMARRAGALAIGVTTGVAQEPDYAASPNHLRAQLVAPNIGAVLDAWRGLR